LWGRPVELILKAISKLTPRKIKIVTVGEMAGTTITIPSAILRSTKVELLGSGIGSLSKETELADYMQNQLAAIFTMSVEGKLLMDLDTYPLSDIETIWSQAEAPGKRNVITI
jgi:hypothetical protein